MAKPDFSRRANAIIMAAEFIPGLDGDKLRNLRDYWRMQVLKLVEDAYNRGVDEGYVLGYGDARKKESHGQDLR